MFQTIRNLVVNRLSNQHVFTTETVDSCLKICEKSQCTDFFFHDFESFPLFLRHLSKASVKREEETEYKENLYF